MGRERYQQKTAFVRRIQPAYDAFEEANKAVSEEQLGLAQEKLNQALALEPRESLFHALQGDIHALNDKPKTAITSYSRAIEANKNLFYGFLRRGQVTYQLKSDERARPDLEHSLELMPTAEAHYLLGMLDKQAKQKESALQHFLAAAQSDSEAGQRATVEYVRLDAPEHPARYVGTRLAGRSGTDAARQDRLPGAAGRWRSGQAVTEHPPGERKGVGSTRKGRDHRSTRGRLSRQGAARPAFYC
jgi:tetratricopeptide (TPR) repeat protein